MEDAVAKISTAIPSQNFTLWANTELPRVVVESAWMGRVSLDEINAKIAAALKGESTKP